MISADSGDMRTVGVEEELLPVDPETGAPVAVAGSVLAGADGLEAELQQQQIEIGTSRVSRWPSWPNSCGTGDPRRPQPPSGPVP